MNNLVYILTERSSSTGNSLLFLIDGVFSSEEKAWNKLEEEFYSFVENHLNGDGKVLSTVFGRRGFIFSYRTHCLQHGYIEYKIVKKDIL